MDGGAWWATVHGVEKSQTRLRDFTFTFTFPIASMALEATEENATVLYSVLLFLLLLLQNDNPQNHEA